MERKKTYLASVSYDGSSFNGWAKQTKLFTVQGFIEKTISSVFSLENFKILGSSRTDKGVHALDQNFTFTFPFNIPQQRLAFVLERSLQQFVKLNKLSEIPSTFHPLHDVRSKEYRYYINTGKNNLFLRKYCWNYSSHLNSTELRKLLKIFEGYHDFFNFSRCRSHSRDKKNTYRKIEKISVFKKENFLIVRIFAVGFLRYQIRAMIGEAVLMIGKPEAHRLLSKMLTAESSQKYKSLAPAGGLYLWRIIFKS